MRINLENTIAYLYIDPKTTLNNLRNNPITPQDENEAMALNRTYSYLAQFYPDKTIRDLANQFLPNPLEIS